MSDIDETDYDNIFPAAPKNDFIVRIDEIHIDRNEELSRHPDNHNDREFNNTRIEVEDD